MDNRYYEKVIEEMQPFLDEQGFKAQENGNFKNDKREIKIAYDEARQMYTLSAADIGEEGDGELKEIEAWLFDDSQNAKDAAAQSTATTEFTVSRSPFTYISSKIS